MSSPVTVLPSSLAAFFVFNPTLGDEQTEGKKILYFHPQIDLNRQKDYVGICEGLINFTKEFSPDNPCEAVHCEKTTYAFAEVEPDYWFVLVVNNSSTRAKGAPENEVEYLEDDLDDAVLQAIVKRAYYFYRLFNGKLMDVADNEDMKRMVGQFMKYYIPTVRFKQIRFYTDIHGFQFLPVDKPTFLMIQYILTKVRSQFPVIKSLAVMHSANLIWSGINQDDTFLLYLLRQGGEAMRHFFTYLCVNRPSTDPAVASGEPEQSVSATDFPKGSCKWLTGPLASINIKGGSLKDRDKCPRTPCVFLQPNKHESTSPEQKQCARPKTTKRLIACQLNALTLFLVAESDESVPTDNPYYRDPHFFKELEVFMFRDLAKLLKALDASNQRIREDHFRFLYFNHTNLALKTSLIKSAPLSMETIQLIRKMHEDFIEAKEKDTQAATSEVYVRTRTNGWLVGRRADASQREFYVLVDDKDGTLSGVEEEVDKLKKNFFYNIFIH